ncbi:hypothetical protein [Marinobacter salarius]|uniref:hypothetical protein n=1 Tax=Marinobacter salarius TaxID=1420917 RepID=UPI0032144D61
MEDHVPQIALVVIALISAVGITGWTVKAKLSSSKKNTNDVRMRGVKAGRDVAGRDIKKKKK